MAWRSTTQKKRAACSPAGHPVAEWPPAQLPQMQRRRCEPRREPWGDHSRFGCRRCRIQRPRFERRFHRHRPRGLPLLNRARCTYLVAGRDRARGATLHPRRVVDRGCGPVGAGLESGQRIEAPGVPLARAIRSRALLHVPFTAPFTNGPSTVRPSLRPAPGAAHCWLPADGFRTAPAWARCWRAASSSLAQLHAMGPGADRETKGRHRGGAAGMSLLDQRAAPLFVVTQAIRSPPVSLLPSRQPSRLPSCRHPDRGPAHGALREASLRAGSPEAQSLSCR